MYRVAMIKLAKQDKKTTSESRPFVRDYVRHSALNAGQAARDARYLLDHPKANGKVESLKLRAPSLVNNAVFTLLPPQLHHTDRELADLDKATAKEWFMNGYNPWDHKIASIESAKPGGGGAGPMPCLEGFGSEIGKSVKKEVDKLKRKLKPGDIINTDPRSPRGPDRLFKSLSKAVQGTRFGHSAMYAGNGHVIESRAHTVVKRPLLDLARCNSLVAMAPKGVSNEDRKRAVSWLGKHIGNDAMRVTLGNLIMHGARPTALSDKHEGVKQKLDKALCSSLIANAYAHVPFNGKRRIADTRPVDILKSDHVTVVGKVK